MTFSVYIFLLTFNKERTTFSTHIKYGSRLFFESVSALSIINFERYSLMSNFVVF
uniref:Uncharacterized protein n=1 Tax=Lepeophtheirus salmonis TaxID=72036 RepID=A0A0K2U6Q8_LEPSM